jgi:hypothetical protein
MTIDKNKKESTDLGIKNNDLSYPFNDYRQYIRNNYTKLSKKI